MHTKYYLLILSLFVFYSTNLFSQRTLEIPKDDKSKKEKAKKTAKETLETKAAEKMSEEAKKLETEAGKRLSSLIKADSKKVQVFKGVSVQRFSIREENRLTGDNIELGPDAGLAGSAGVSRFIAGYIQDSFSYSQEDSETLSQYVLFYNYKHRGNLDYISSNFVKPLGASAKKEKLGFPEKGEWKGKSQIVIPTEKNALKNGGLDLALFELEDQVNADVENQKGGAETKKKFSSLQNRKLKTEKDEAAEKLDSYSKKEKELTDRKKQVEDRLKEIAKDPEKNRAETAKLEAEKRKIESDLPAISSDKKDFEAKIEQLARREDMKKLGFSSEKEYAAYSASKKKADDPKKDPLANDGKNTKPDEEKHVPAPEELSEKYNHAYHSKTGIIAGRESLLVPQTGIITIGYQLPVTEKSELMLYLIGPGEFEVVKTSEGIKLHSKSPMIFHEGKLFVFEELSGKVYLSQLNTNLEIESRSSDPIEADTYLSFTSDTVSVHRRKKINTVDDVRYFRKKDLSLISGSGKTEPKK